LNPGPLPPITANDLDFVPVNYDFATFTANAEAELPSLEGAIDLTLGDFIISVADQTTLIASLFDGLDDLGNIPGEIDGMEFDQTAAELSQAATDGDTLLSGFTSLITGASGSGGSGGGGGGIGGSGGCDTIDFGSVPTSSAGGANSFEAQWFLQNNLNTVVAVKGPSFNPASGGRFTLNPYPNGKQIHPGDTLTVTIVFTPLYPGSYSTTLTLLTDAPDPQPCVKLSGTGTGGSLKGPPIPGS